MKNITIIALTLALAFSLCGCRMNSEETNAPDQNTTVADTTAPTEAPTTAPTVTTPIVIDPTIDSNIPDPNVDNDHLIDPTDGSGAM